MKKKFFAKRDLPIYLTSLLIILVAMLVPKNIAEIVPSLMSYLHSFSALLPTLHEYSAASVQPDRVLLVLSLSFILAFLLLPWCFYWHLRCTDHSLIRANAKAIWLGWLAGVFAFGLLYLPGPEHATTHRAASLDYIAMQSPFGLGFFGAFLFVGEIYFLIVFFSWIAALFVRTK